MKHEWMRQNRVDISKYLPAFLGLDSRFKVTNQADSKEHERLRIALQDVFDQFFVKSATWGLKEWEELLALTPNNNASYEERRVRVITKLQSHQTSTLDFMTKLVNLYLVDGGSILIDHPENYTLEIQLPNGEVKDYTGLENAIATYIPAHIGYELVYRTYDTYQMFAVQSSYEQEYLSEEIKNLADSKAEWYVGFGSSLTRLVEIRGAEFDSHISTKQYGYVVGGTMDTEVLNELRNE